MTLLVGTNLGPYEITGALGVGGMGEVYRARDTKLNRDVALKILPDLFARDPDRLARFKREAQVLASLNHPNIAAIYGFEDSSDVHALVLELVEGPTLADRIASGPMTLDDAVPAARQICDALDAAHEQGIIHRDLKPANVKVRSDGTVKVLDFGLAKLTGPSGAGDPSRLANSPTMMASMPGTIVGTAAYMAPEQAKGREADRSSDVWAFGCVLYEMLTGIRAFPGDSVSEVIANVLKTEPDWSRVPAGTAGIERLLRRCLQKDPKRRLRDIRDARIDIDEAHAEPGAVHGPPLASRRNERLAWLSALVLVTGAAAAIVLGHWGGAPATTSPAEMRVEINTPPTADPTSLAISPDGRTLAFVAPFEGQPRLWLRPLETVAARPLPETDGASFPFWSPDGRFLAFFADGQLKEVGIDGGSPRILVNASGGVGGTWSRGGVILFSGLGTPILRISDRGGDPTPATRLEGQQGAHYQPQFLPDGRHFLYWAVGSRTPNGVYVGDLDGPETHRLLEADVSATYASQGYLLFVRQGTLFAQRFEPTGLALSGAAFPVAEQVTKSSNQLRAAVSTSAAGPIVYRAGSTGGSERQLTWFDRSGRPLANVGAPFRSTQLSPSLSPDGHRVALFRGVNGNIDIWLLDLDRDVPTRLTFDAADDVRPVWSRDGGRIVFNSNRMGVHDLYQKAASSAGSEETVLLQTTQSKSATDWSPNGRFLLYDSIDLKKNVDIWALPLDGDRKPFAVVQTDFEEHGGQFSPDGRWIAYVSIKSGRYEVYVRPFQRSGDEIRISTDGGDQVRWRSDGRELFYIGRDSQLVAVPIRLGSNNETAEVGTPVPLFATRVGDWRSGPQGVQYVVAPDGQRFLMNTLSGEVITSPITMILNWKPK